MHYSRNKGNGLSLSFEESDEETLEVWESFTTRFSRVIDIFLTKYIEIVTKLDDPGFDGSLRDYLNLAEKRGRLTDVDRWLSMRELRNVQAHEYTDQSISAFIQAIQVEADYVLKHIPEILIFDRNK